MMTPMQPIYLTGHSIPVRKVMHNMDGDLLFSCSDDGKVCMYDTRQCIRLGLFDIKESCRSIDVTTDSKYMIAAATTVGMHVFSTSDGKKVATVNVPGLYSKQVSLAFGDKLIFCLYEHEKKSSIRVFDFEDILKRGDISEPAKSVGQIDGTKDFSYNYAVWGPLNKTIYVATNTGKVMIFDVSNGKCIKKKSVHKDEIFQLQMTHDYTMLTTSSRDGDAKVLHPETLDEVRVFNYGQKPCRSAQISPLFDDRDHQKFHIAIAGGQEARDVAMMNIEGSGFEIKL